MMKLRMLGNLLTLWSLCAAAILAVRVGSAWQPTPLQALFTFPDGTLCRMPCMFGVSTGTAEPTAVINMLDAHPLILRLSTKGSERPHEQFISIRETGISAYVRLNKDRVYTLSFNAFSRVSDLPVEEHGIGKPLFYATLGDALALWGPPTSIEIVRNLVSLKMYVALCYQPEYFCIGFMGPRSPRISLDLPFYSYYATDPQQMDAILRKQQAEHAVYPWVGVTLVENYWRRFRYTAN
jgi:hypothetical protein